VLKTSSVFGVSIKLSSFKIKYNSMAAMRLNIMCRKMFEGSSEMLVVDQDKGKVHPRTSHEGPEDE